VKVTFGHLHAINRHDAVAETRPPEWIPSNLPPVGAGRHYLKSHSTSVIPEGERTKVMANHKDGSGGESRENVCTHSVPLPCASW
jgi:hypothetical protein